MKIGPLEFYWHPGVSSVHDAVTSTVKTDPAFRQLVARMARAEVKSYLAEIAEQAGVPFESPSAFLAAAVGSVYDKEG